MLGYYEIWKSHKSIYEIQIISYVYFLDLFRSEFDGEDSGDTHNPATDDKEDE